MLREKSEQLFKEAATYIPGGVNSPVRAFKSVGIPPIFAQKASGSKIVDVDGNTYIDYICSWGPLMLGHSSDIALNGVMEAMTFGSSYGVPTAIEVEIAKLISNTYCNMELVRMVNSGTEATMSALRVARGYTKREKIIKFEGCYHGHGDGLLVKSGSGTLTYGVPTSAGVTAGTVKDTLVAVYNDINSVKALFEANKGEIAAVILEPIAGNMGLVPPKKEFLHALREITREEGTVLIFDEVITGFRASFKGAADIYGIEPDMTCLGKIIGGGLPVGAYGGKREIMEVVAPIGTVYQAGTLSGNPIAMRMGLNVLSYLENHPNVYEHIEKLAIRLEEGLKSNIEKTGIKATVNRVKGMVCLFFTDKKVDSYKAVMTSDTELYSRYFIGMLDKGILLPPAQFECMFLSYAHTEEDIEKTISASYEVFCQLV